MHGATIVLTAPFFLRCYFFASTNIKTYGLGRETGYPHWRKWLIPIINLGSPQDLTDILSASTMPTSLEKPDTSATRLTPFQRYTCLAFLISWIGLLAPGTSFAAAYWIAYARRREIPFTLLTFDVAFQIFSITGATCLIVLVMRIIRLQRKRNKEAYFCPPPGRWLPLDQQTSDGWSPV